MNSWSKHVNNNNFEQNVCVQIYDIVYVPFLLDFEMEKVRI